MVVLLFFVVQRGGGVGNVSGKIEIIWGFCFRVLGEGMKQILCVMLVLHVLTHLRRDIFFFADTDIGGGGSAAKYNVMSLRLGGRPARGEIDLLSADTSLQAGRVVGMLVVAQLAVYLRCRHTEVYTAVNRDKSSINEQQKN